MGTAEFRCLRGCLQVTRENGWRDETFCLQKKWVALYCCDNKINGSAEMVLSCWKNGGRITEIFVTLGNARTTRRKKKKKIKCRDSYQIQKFQWRSKECAISRFSSDIKHMIEVGDITDSELQDFYLGKFFVRRQSGQQFPQLGERHVEGLHSDAFSSGVSGSVLLCRSATPASLLARQRSHLLLPAAKIRTTKCTSYRSL